MAIATGVLPARCVTPATHVRVDQCGLITPVNLRAFSAGALFDRRVLTLQPVLHRFRALLIGALDGLLRSEPPAREVLADAANLQLDAEFLINELAYGGATPQAEIHLQLVGSLGNDQSLNGFFLNP